MNAVAISSRPPSIFHTVRFRLLRTILTIGGIVPFLASAQVSELVPVARYTVLSTTQARHEVGNLLNDNTFRTIASSTLTVFPGDRPILEAISGKVVIDLPTFDQRNVLGQIPNWRRSDVRYTYSFVDYVIVCVTGKGDPNAPSVLSVSPVLAAAKGSPYSATLEGIAGTAPYAWDLVAGALPAGLSLSSGGTIAGTPTTAGTASFTVRLTDAQSRTATKVLSLTVVEPPPSPNLIPFRPQDWPDAIVLSAESGTHQNTVINDGDIVYLDFAFAAEDQSIPINKTFWAAIAIDGVAQYSWFWDELPAYSYANVFDCSFGPLAAGTHTAELRIDTENAIAETREDDNVYAVTFDVVSRLATAARLMKGVPSAPVSAGAGKGLYFVFSVPPDQERLQVTTMGGSGDCNLFLAKSRLPTASSYDSASTTVGTAESIVLTNPAAGDYYIFVSGASAFSGVTVLADCAPLLPAANLRPRLIDASYAAQLVLSDGKGARRDVALIYDDAPLYASFGFEAEPGTKDIVQSFTVALYVDDVRITQWSYTGLHSGSTDSKADVPIGALRPGTHFITLVLDPDGAVPEARETDNRLTTPFVVSTRAGDSALFDKIVILDAAGNLFVVTPSTGAIERQIGKTSVLMNNIAFHPCGILYGLGQSELYDTSLYRIDTTTAACSIIPATTFAFVSLGFADDGTLYGGTELRQGYVRFSSLDTRTGAEIKRYTVPTSLSLGGDLANDGVGGLFSITDAGALIRWSSTAASWTTIGTTGLLNVYGLALAADDTLYAFGKDKRIWRIDKATGAATMAATITDPRVGDVYGAAGEFRSGRGVNVRLVEAPKGALVSMNGAGFFGFSFPTAPGVHYHIERASEAASPVWTWVQSVSGDGATKDYYAPRTTASAYYRVRGFPSGFLRFPLRPSLGTTPHTAPMSSVLDHNGPGAAPDGSVVAYTGERGELQWGELTEVVSGTTLHAYAGETKAPFRLDGQYTQPSAPQYAYLYYDGHTGFDYPAPNGKGVFAACAGTAVQGDFGGGPFDVCVTGAPPFSRYRTYYLHLVSNTIGTTPREVARGERIGAVGSDHLHFTVKLDEQRIDPYGWQGVRGQDPLGNGGQDSVCLWADCD